MAAPMSGPRVTRSVLGALLVASVAAGCTALLGLSEPSAAPEPDAAPPPDAGVADAAPDAPVFDAAPPPDARGNPSMPVVVGQPFIRGMALDLNTVYWSTDDGPIMRVNKDGSAPNMLAMGPVRPEGTMAVHDGFVYWTTREPQQPFRAYRSSAGGGGAFFRILGSTGSPYALVPADDGLLFVNGPNLFHAGLDGTNQTMIWPLTTVPYYMARTATHVFWSDAATVAGKVKSLALADGSEKTVASGLDQPITLVTDGTRAFWCNYGQTDPAGGGGILEHTSSIMSALPDGSDTKVLVSGETRIVAIAVDEGFVYWYSFDQLAVVRRAKDGTGPIEVVSVPSTSAITQLEVDASFVYVVAFSQIERALKVPP
jgi:hypothetical protein